MAEAARLGASVAGVPIPAAEVTSAAEAAVAASVAVATAAAVTRAAAVVVTAVVAATGATKNIFLFPVSGRSFTRYR